MTDFGDELHRFLAERGISLSAAARQAGCSKGYLSNAANGRKPLTPRVAAALDRLFGEDGTFAAYALVAPSGSSGSPHAAGTVIETPARPVAARSTREIASGTAHGDSAAEEPAGAEEGRTARLCPYPPGRR